MRNLVATPKFRRSHRKFVKKNQTLQKAIEQTLIRLQTDAFDPILKTHGLKGNLYGIYACSCGYDCRIVFSIVTRIENEGMDDEIIIEEIILENVGKHDEVY